MNSLIRRALIVSTLTAAAAVGKGETGSENGLEQSLRVRLYDQAHVRPEALVSAMSAVMMIFKSAGVNVDWKQISSEPPEDIGLDMSSVDHHNTDGRSYVVVRLRRGTLPTVFPGALGFALPFARSGAHVSIFYDRVETLSLSVNAPLYVVLGHAIAHEIGHVLLCSSDHTSGGLMHARWNQSSWKLASAGVLGFTEAEARQLRRAAALRNEYRVAGK